jgi:diguanylate cyclase (GGDEF)-like protein/PAS domain S-box-containing protein
VLKINKSRLSYKIFLTLSAVFLSIFILGSWVAYTLVRSVINEHLEHNLNNTVNTVQEIIETSADLSIRSYLRSVVEQNTIILTDLYSQSEKGAITEDEAKSRAQSLFRIQKIGTSGYNYIINSQGVTLLHPYPEIEGTNVLHLEFIREQIKMKEGFLQYAWKNPDEPQTRQKYLYMKYFQPWDWILTVSAYRDESDRLVQPEDFSKKVLAINISENGYPLVIDQSGQIIVHPFLSGNVLQDDRKETAFIRNMLKQKKGKISFIYLDPRDGKSRKMAAFFQTVKDSGWLVAAVGYVDDFYAPLKTLKNVFVTLIGLGVFCSILVSYFLSKSITSPLNRLLETLSSQSHNFSIPQESSRNKDEVEEISDYFSLYIERLSDYNTRLKNLLEAQQKSTFDLSIFKEVFEHSAEGIVITDVNGIIIKTNPAFHKITGFSVAESIGQSPRILKSDQHSPEFFEAMWNSIRNQGFWAGEIWNRRKSGETYPEWLTISAIKDKDGNTTHYAAVFNDITTIVEQKKHIEFLAYHDYLTELPNRLLLIESLARSFATCKRHGGEIAWMIIDLDNFKTVNDSMGHSYGDTLLKQYVERTVAVIRREEVLGRIGGDEFVLIVHSQSPGLEHLISIVKRLNSCVEEPFILQEQKVYLTLSIGVAIYPDDAQTTEDLVKRADLALSRAKLSTGNSFNLFAPDMEEKVKKKLHYLAQIRSGLENEEFLPFFQPKINLLTGKAVGMEALARWQSGDTLVNPGDFIPIAEQTGLIVPLAKQIYRQAFQETAKLIQDGYDLKLSVNLSPPQLKDDNFLDELISLQQQSGLQPGLIELEVTESALMENVMKSRKILDEIAEIGFKISIDDFGTGYSSLQYLKQLPLHTLKIDMSFVSGIGKSKDDEALVQIIIMMAQQFGLDIIAEGIEDISQEDFLRNHGCNRGQGFLYGKPMDIMTFREWLAKNS